MPARPVLAGAAPQRKVRLYIIPLISCSQRRSCKAVFVDTDAVPARDSRVGDLTQNVPEAVLVQQLVAALSAGGVRGDQIGVLSLYRQQIKLLSHLLRAHPAVEILTADRSQGRDKDCIIVSMVRSNDDGQVRPPSAVSVASVLTKACRLVTC